MPEQEGTASTGIQNFLQPQSMLTPGIAGALVLTISLPVTACIGIKFNWVALALSFLIAILIIQQGKIKSLSLQGISYTVLNALIIFASCTGAMDKVNPRPEIPTLDPQILKMLQVPTNGAGAAAEPFWAPASAHAQTDDQPAAATKPDEEATMPDAAAEPPMPDAPAAPPATQFTPRQSLEIQQYLKALEAQKAYDQKYRGF
ncbi:MAG: hypothetical protein AB7D57_02630 [Desulfovibrionaceae bacterium]